MQVKFVDDSKLRMTEHTRIVIDNVVFDNDPSKSDLAMTFAQGTARFITGSLGTIEKENIRLRTPTASIGIRGTDFTVTVDEFGRTLVILLPDINGISSGEIIVATMTGEVVLNKPFESTTTSVGELPPSNPAILNLTLDMLDNILIITPPTERQTLEEFYSSTSANRNINPLDIDFLDEALLENEELEKDYLEFTELDINFLDVELLENLLESYSDLDSELLKEEQQSGDVDIEGTEEGFDTVTQVSTIVDGQSVTLTRNVSDIVVIKVDQSAETEVIIEQDGKLLDPITINGSTTTINITQ
jgi:virulence-associated protein VapD